MRTNRYFVKYRYVENHWFRKYFPDKWRYLAMTIEHLKSSKFSSVENSITRKIFDNCIEHIAAQVEVAVCDCEIDIAFVSLLDSYTE